MDSAPISHVFPQYSFEGFIDWGEPVAIILGISYDYAMLVKHDIAILYPKSFIYSNTGAVEEAKQCRHHELMAVFRI